MKRTSTPDHAVSRRAKRQTRGPQASNPPVAAHAMHRCALCLVFPPGALSGKRAMRGPHPLAPLVGSGCFLGASINRGRKTVHEMTFFGNETSRNESNAPVRYRHVPHTRASAGFPRHGTRSTGRAMRAPGLSPARALISLQAHEPPPSRGAPEPEHARQMPDEMREVAATRAACRMSHAFSRNTQGLVAA